MARVDAARWEGVKAIRVFFAKPTANEEMSHNPGRENRTPR